MKVGILLHSSWQILLLMAIEGRAGVEKRNLLVEGTDFCIFLVCPLLSLDLFCHPDQYGIFPYLFRWDGPKIQVSGPRRTN